VKKYLIAGLLTWLPLAITIWVLLWVLGVMDGVFEWLLATSQAVLPEAARASIERWRHIPGLGVLAVAALLVVTGVFVTNIFGQWFVRQWDGVLSRIPIVKSIYNSVKQVSDTLFSSNGNAFREAVLLRWPHGGAWTIGFITGAPVGEVTLHLPAGEHVSVYVPTTPNPTGGYFVMVAKADVVPLRMSVDEALKYIISMGVVEPPPPAPAPVQH
jgi:uncharacterized membrane protein